MIYYCMYVLGLPCLVLCFGETACRIVWFLDPDIVSKEKNFFLPELYHDGT